MYTLWRHDTNECKEDIRNYFMFKIVVKTACKFFKIRWEVILKKPQQNNIRFILLRESIDLKRYIDLLIMYFQVSNK